MDSAVMGKTLNEISRRQYDLQQQGRWTEATAMQNEKWAYANSFPEGSPARAWCAEWIRTQ